MPEVVRTEMDGAVAVVTLNRPDKLNAMNREVFEALRETGLALETDASVRAVLLRGEGRAFSSGLDLASFADGGLAGGGDGIGPTGVTEAIGRTQEGFVVWPRMLKPVVAAVHGYAMGAGIQLALAADIRLCAEGTTLSVFESTYGLVPDLGGTHHLVRLVGPAVAKELTWTARKFSAEDALEMGIVNRVVPADRLQDEALALARDLAARPPLAVQLGKQLLNDAHELTLEENMRRVAHAQSICLLSEDLQEAVAAAFEKRQGEFKGR